MRDLQIGRANSGHDLATLHGKGGKTRQCPLWAETERVLADQIAGSARSMTRYLSAGSESPSPALGLSADPAIRGAGAGIGGQNYNPSCDPAHNGLPLGSRRRGHQHHPRLARPRLDQHHQHRNPSIVLTLKANAVALCEVGQSKAQPFMEVGQGS